MNDILEKILAQKREEVAILRRRASLEAFDALASVQTSPRGFAAALRARVDAGRPAVIAEIKKASPSKGLIRTDYDPAAIAQDYERGGAACLSVLTDTRFFLGANDHLQQARGACRLPVLRKDFIVDPLQVAEARSLGADCVLLIAAALGNGQLGELAGCATERGMDVLVEIHDRAELELVLRTKLPPVLLGINNRSLRSFDTRLETTLELVPSIPPGYEVVTESGIAGAADLARLRAAGVHRFLIGESLMRAESPGATLREWLA